MAEALLQVDGLTKRFGGVIASDNVDARCPAGELHAIIGPNGAGKTTLIGQLAGESRPTPDGSSSPATTSPRYRRGGAACCGLARSFQITSLFPRFHRARQRRAGGAGACRALVPFLARRARRARAAASRRAQRSSASACRPRRHRGRHSISHGEHRQLEIAMALATGPRMLLLDEPMAGLGRRIRPHGGAAARAEARIHDPAGRARYGRGLRARRPHHRAGLWPRHRHRRAGSDPRQCARCARPISARSDVRGSAMSDALLELSEVETCYGRSQVLFGVSLAVGRGEMVTLMGRNGMGKTTTVRSIMGLTPREAGSIRFDGEEIRELAVLPRSRSSASVWCRKAGRFSRISRCGKISSRPPPNGGSAQSHGRSPRVYELFPRLAERARSAWASSCPAASSRCWRSAAR